MKLMLFLWPSLNLGHISVIGTSKWHLSDVDLETPLSPFLIWQGYLTLNVDINFVFEIYTKSSLIWYIELYDLIEWRREVMMERYQ